MPTGAAAPTPMTPTPGGQPYAISVPQTTYTYNRQPAAAAPIQPPQETPFSLRGLAPQTLMPEPVTRPASYPHVDPRPSVLPMVTRPPDPRDAELHDFADSLDRFDAQYPMSAYGRATT